MTTTQGIAPEAALDEERAAAFAERVLGFYTGGFLTYMIDLGLRTGLLEAAAQGTGTSDELAARAGVQERYTREWLGALVTAGVVDYDPTTREYTLPAEHAVCLTGATELNVAPMSRISSHLAAFVGPVADAFRHGGGVPYAAYRPEFTDVMDELGRAGYDALLVDAMVPLVSGLGDRLANGARVADIGCGTGHTTNLLAQAFPASRFLGCDLADDAIARATAEAREMGLANVAFQVRDVAAWRPEETFGVAFAFDAIHDQADPAGVLDRIYDALEPGGVLVMVDIRASSRLEDNLDNPFAPWLYSISTLHCLTVSLANDGAGLGTVWGEERALEMLSAAHFVDLEVHEVPGDPLDSLYVARKPA